MQIGLIEARRRESEKKPDPLQKPQRMGHPSASLTGNPLLPEPRKCLQNPKANPTRPYPRTEKSNIFHHASTHCDVGYLQTILGLSAASLRHAACCLNFRNREWRGSLLLADLHCYREIGQEVVV